MMTSLSVLLIDTNFMTRNAHVAAQIRFALHKHPHFSPIYHRNYETLIQTARAVKPDLLLAIDGQRLQPDILRRAASYCGASALWVFEDPYTFEDNQRHAELFDLVFTNDQNSASRYDTNAYYLPLAAEAIFDDLHPISNETSFRYDVFFCGTAWPNRVHSLASLIREAPDLEYKIVLHYNQYIPKIPLPLPKSTYVTSINFANFLRIANRSRITLGLGRKYASKGGDAASLSPPPRLFEVAHAGGFQLIDANECTLSPHFTDQEIGTFEHSDRCLDKIRYHLSNFEDRISRTESAHRTARARHSYTNRLDTILDHLSSLSPRGAATQRSESLRDKISVPTKPPSTAYRRRPRVLFVVHNALSTPPFGGLEIHQDIVAQNVKHKFEIFFYFKDRSTPEFVKKDNKECYTLTDDNYNIIDSFLIEATDTKKQLSNPPAENLFGHVLLRYGIDLVHFFHFLNHVPSISSVCSILNIPYICSIHDFYSACIKFNLLDQHNRYCGNTAELIEQCDECLMKTHGIPFGSQSIRRAFFSRVFADARAIVTVSRSTKDILVGFYPELFDDEKVIVHGAPLPSMFAYQKCRNHRNCRNVDDNDRSLSIVILGNLTVAKGAQILTSAISHLKTEPILFHIHGNTDPSVKEAILKTKSENVTIHGPYEPGGVDLSSYDLSLHLSIWPETHCQTLSEAWAAGLVPIVTDIGALDERVEDGETGFKISAQRPFRLIGLLRELLHRRSEIARIRENILSRGESLFFTHERHASLFLELYSDVAARRESNPEIQPFPKSPAPLSLETAQRGMRNLSWYRTASTTQGQPIEPADSSICFESDLNLREVGRANVDKINNLRTDGTMTIPLDRTKALSASGWFFAEESYVGRAPTFLLLHNENERQQILVPLKLHSREDVAKKFGARGGYLGGWQLSETFLGSAVRCSINYNCLIAQYGAGVALTYDTKLELIFFDHAATEYAPLHTFGVLHSSSTVTPEYFAITDQSILLHPPSAQDGASTAVFCADGSSRGISGFSVKCRLTDSRSGDVVVTVKLCEPSSGMAFASSVTLSSMAPVTLRVSLPCLFRDSAVQFSTSMASDDGSNDYACCVLDDPQFEVFEGSEDDFLAMLAAAPRNASPEAEPIHLDTCAEVTAVRTVNPRAL